MYRIWYDMNSQPWDTLLSLCGHGMVTLVYFPHSVQARRWLHSVWSRVSGGCSIVVIPQVHTPNDLSTLDQNKIPHSGIGVLHLGLGGDSHHKPLRFIQIHYYGNYFFLKQIASFIYFHNLEKIYKIQRYLHLHNAYSENALFRWGIRKGSSYFLYFSKSVWKVIRATTFCSIKIHYAL